MIIGFDGSRAFIPEKTGTENYSYQLLKALARFDPLRPASPRGEREASARRAKIDRKNSYIIYTKSFNLDTAVALMKFPENFKIMEIPWKRFWTQGGLAFETFKDKLDVLFVPAHTLPIIRRPGLKTVVTVHDLGSEYLPAMHQLKQRLYLSFMQRFQLKSASKIIAVSKATKDDLVKRIGIEPDKIEVVYEGYDREQFKTQNSKLKSDALIDRLMHYYLFVGTVQPRKNLERVIRAFNVVARQGTKKRSRDQIAHLRFVSRQTMTGDMEKVVRSTTPHFLIAPDFATLNLVIVGAKGWLSDEIYQLPKKLGIEGRVKFLGYVPDEKLPALYSGAIALLFPSLFEGFGLPILEAQACGCPVITSNISSMPEVAGDGAILVNPYSIEDIIRGIGEIRGIRDKIIKKGYENVKRFSWEKCAAQTLEVLEKA